MIPRKKRAHSCIRRPNTLVVRSCLGENGANKITLRVFIGSKHVTTTTAAFNDNMRWNFVKEMARNTPLAPSPLLKRNLHVEIGLAIHGEKKSKTQLVRNIIKVSTSRTAFKTNTWAVSNGRIIMHYIYKEISWKTVFLAFLRRLTP